jgi:hypothetical protein
MAVPEGGSYFSRFVLKFVEIIAAGLATAVSGYLIAHLSGVLSSPVPAPGAAVSQVAPSMQSGPPAQPTSRSSRDVTEPRNAPQESAHAAASAQPAPPQQEVNALPDAQPAPPQQEVNALPDAQPARSSVSATKTTPSHKRIETSPTPAASKRDQESFVARVRAALGDADRTDPLGVPPKQSAVSRGPAAVASPPTSDPTGSIGAAPPGATELRSATAPQVPIEANPLTTVEIKSRPVTTIQSSPAPSPMKETDGLSPLEQMLRHDPFTGSNDAPRPPMPVGE